VAFVARPFVRLSDPCRHNRLHPLVSLVTIAVLAVLCNADRWAAVVRFARQEGKWLGLFVPLPHGIPSRQTFQRVFALGCQKDIARKIVEEGGDYCLAVKDNPATLHRKVIALLDEGMLEGFKGWDAQMDPTAHSGMGGLRRGRCG